MGTTTTTFALNKPTVGGDDNAWGTDWNTNADKLDDLLDGTIGITPNLISGWEVGGVAVTATAAELNLVAAKVPRTSATGSAALPVGTTAERDGTPLTGYFRFNSTLGVFEGYNGSAWGGVGGATGGGADRVFYENGQTVTTNYTITNGTNAMSAGPITIDAGVTVTVGTGEVWTVV